MALEGIYVNGVKQKFLPQDILDGDVVVDGSITKTKLAGTLNRQVDGSGLNDLSLNVLPFMSLYDTGYTALQGMCIIDNQYLVVVRYKNSNTKRAFAVYDVINKIYVTETVFDASEVGHCNSMTYAEPYIYVTSDQGVVKLLYDNSDHSLTLPNDSEVYNGEIPVGAIAYYDDKFYILNQGDTHFTLYSTSDFVDFDVCGTSTFDKYKPSHEQGEKPNYLTIQGLDIYEGYVFITFSASFTGAQTEDLIWRFEAIYVTDLELNVLRINEYPRSEYGESEDCGVISINGQQYLIITTNRNDTNVGSIYAVPVFQNTKTLETFYTWKKANGSIYMGTSADTDTFKLYVDNSRSAPFARGTQSDPFDSFETAIKIAKQLNVAVEIIVSGVYTNELYVRWVTNPLWITFDGATIQGIDILDCNLVYLSGKANTTTTMGRLYIDRSIVMMRSGIVFDKSLYSSTVAAMQILRSFFSGVTTSVGSGYTCAVSATQSVVVCRIVENNANASVRYNDTSMVAINGILDPIKSTYEGGVNTRPSVGLRPGMGIYDAQLKIPIWWNGTTWVNASGESV